MNDSKVLQILQISQEEIIFLDLEEKADHTHTQSNQLFSVPIPTLSNFFTNIHPQLFEKYRQTDKQTNQPTGVKTFTQWRSNNKNAISPMLLHYIHYIHIYTHTHKCNETKCMNNNKRSAAGIKCKQVSEYLRATKHTIPESVIYSSLQHAHFHETYAAFH